MNHLTHASKKDPEIYPDIAIARDLLVSKERVRFVRKKLGKPFVEARGRPRKSA